MARSAETVVGRPVAGLPAWASYPWIVLLASFLVQTSAALGFRGLSPLAPFLVDDLGLTRSQFGFLVTATTVGATLTLILAGNLSDRFGVRGMFLLALVASGAFLVVGGLAPDYGWLLGALALFGLGFGFALPPTTRAIVDWFPHRRRGLPMGIKQTGLAVGGVICGFVVPPLSFAMGWRGALIALGLATMASGVLAWLLYRDRQHRPDSGDTAPRAPFSKVLRDRDLLLLSGVTCLYAAVQLSILGFLVLFLGERVGLAAAGAGMLLALAEGTGVVGRIGWGVVSDTLFGGRRKVVMGIIGVLAGLSCLALATMGPDTPMALLVAVLALAGISAVGWNGINMIFVAEIAGKQSSATAAGVNLTASYLGIIVGPPLFGLVVDATGSYTTAFQLGAAISVVALLLLWRIRSPNS